MTDKDRRGLFDELLMLTTVAGHLYRAGEKYSADTILAVKSNLFEKLSVVSPSEEALRKMVSACRRYENAHLINAAHGKGHSTAEEMSAWVELRKTIREAEETDPEIAESKCG